MRVVFKTLWKWDGGVHDLRRRPHFEILSAVVLEMALICLCPLVSAFMESSHTALSSPLSSDWPITRGVSVTPASPTRYFEET